MNGSDLAPEQGRGRVAADPGGESDRAIKSMYRGRRVSSTACQPASLYEWGGNATQLSQFCSVVRVSGSKVCDLGAQMIHYWGRTRPVRSILVRSKRLEHQVEGDRPLLRSLRPPGRERLRIRHRHRDRCTVPLHRKSEDRLGHLLWPKFPSGRRARSG